MNKVVSASVGGREFSFNEDAYDRLQIISGTSSHA